MHIVGRQDMSLELHGVYIFKVSLCIYLHVCIYKR